MTIPIRNIYYLLCYAWRQWQENELVDVSTLDRLHQAQDLLAKVLAEGTFRLVRRGIDRGYREVTGELAGVRGKLELGATAKTGVRARGRLICTFEEFSADVLHNQIVRSTLDILLRSPTLDRAVHEDVRLAYEKMEGVSLLSLRPSLFRRVQLSRNQTSYYFLLSVCQLLYDSLLIDEQTGNARFFDFRKDDKRMWRLFEDFVLEFLRREQRGYRVAGQQKVPWHDIQAVGPMDESLLPDMRPDIVLESAQRRLVVDTKYYRKPLSEWWGSKKIRSDNLYQLLCYIESRQVAFPAGPFHEGMLLYAAVNEQLRADLKIRGHRVQVRSVDLSKPWQEVHAELLSVLE